MLGQLSIAEQTLKASAQSNRRNSHLMVDLAHTWRSSKKPHIMWVSEAHAEQVQFPALVQALSPSVLHQKLVTVTPLTQKMTLPCSSQGVSHPRGPPSQQKY